MAKSSVPYPLPLARGGQTLWVQSTGEGRCHLVVRERAGNITEKDSWVTPAGETIDLRDITIQVACPIGSVSFHDFRMPVFGWQLHGHLPGRMSNGGPAVTCVNCAEIARIQ
jgi:hypothetical protein